MAETQPRQDLQRVFHSHAWASIWFAIFPCESGLPSGSLFGQTSPYENHENTYFAVAAFDNPRGDAYDRGNEVADPRGHN